MFQTLIVGLGRSGRGLHLPVLSRLRAMQNSHHLFDNRPIVAFAPCETPAEVPGAVLARSWGQASSLARPHRTVVHLCSPPTTRVEVLEQLAQLGFRKIVVEKPIAVDEPDLTEITRLRQRWDLQLAVVAPWLASTLTHRILQTLRSGELGTLRSVSVVQRKARFTRSVAGCGHPTAFDVEMPHSVGVALAIAGDATVGHARCTDLRLEDVVVPRLGSAWLSLEHEGGVRTDIYSDLSSPTRERRITLQGEHGTMTGYYPNSEADHTAQLTTTTRGGETRRVFGDDALSAFLLRTYERFATGGPDGGELALNVEVVHLLSDAKARCPASSPPGGALPRPPTRRRERGEGAYRPASAP